MRYFGADYDTEFKPTAENDKEKTHLVPDENITTVGAGRFHRAVYCSNQISLVEEPVGSATVLVPDLHQVRR